MEYRASTEEGHPAQRRLDAFFVKHWSRGLTGLVYDPDGTKSQTHIENIRRYARNQDIDKIQREGITIAHLAERYAIKRDRKQIFVSDEALRLPDDELGPLLVDYAYTAARDMRRGLGIAPGAYVKNDLRRGIDDRLFQLLLQMNALTAQVGGAAARGMTTSPTAIRAATELGAKRLFLNQTHPHTRYEQHLVEALTKKIDGQRWRS